MPELPEVQAVTELLSRALRGRRIVRGQINRARLLAPADPQVFARALRRARIEAVSRRAKSIRIDLDRGRTLVAHLRMTGNLYVSPAREAISRYASAAFDLDNGARLVFEDPRGLGTLRLLPREKADDLLRRLGAEPMSREFTPMLLFRQSRNRSTPLKIFLMDQRHVGGLGNIYAAEALWRARLDPRRPAASLTRADAARLHRAIRAVLEEATASARKWYRRPGGRDAAEDFHAGVYDREGQPCRRCKWPVRRIAQGGRSTFFCSRCQA